MTMKYNPCNIPPPPFSLYLPSPLVRETFASQVTGAMLQSYFAFIPAENSSAYIPRGAQAMILRVNL